MFLKRKKFLVLVIAVIAIGIVLFLKSKNNGIKYEGTTLTKTVVKRSVTASGEVKSKNEVELSFLAIGRLANLSVTKGDIVKKGDLLANLNFSSSYQTTKALADARDVALRDVDLYIENYSTNLQAAGGLDEYNLNLRRLNELVEKAQATYEAQVAGNSDLFIYAPFEATIIDTYYTENETVPAGSPVIKLADLENLIFEAKVDQEDFGLLKVGQPVIVTLDSYDDFEFEGQVVELPLYAKDASDFEIKVAVKSSDENPILLGMLGDIEIIVAQTENEVDALFFDSIFTDEKGSFVWVLAENEKDFEKKYIEIGLEGDLYTEVLTDISNSTLVIPEEE